MSEVVLNNIGFNPSNIPVKQSIFKEYLKFRYLEHLNNHKLNILKQSTIPSLQGNPIFNTRKQYIVNPVQSNRYSEMSHPPLIPKLNKFRGPRAYFTSFQLDELQKEFENNEILDREKRVQLAKYINLTEKQVMNWFHNRRAKLRENGNKQRYSHSNKNCTTTTSIPQDLNSLNVSSKIEKVDSKKSTNINGLLNHLVQQQYLPSYGVDHTNTAHNRQWQGNSETLYSPINPKLSNTESRKIGGRQHFTRFQLVVLEKEFENDNYLGNKKKAQLLAQSLKLTEEQVQVWFNNKRATFKTSEKTNSSPSYKNFSCSFSIPHDPNCLNMRPSVK